MLRALGLALLLLVPAGASAADPTPAERLKAIRAECDGATKLASVVNHALNENVVGFEIYRIVSGMSDAAQSRGFGQALDLAKEDPAGDAAFEAVEWILMTPRSYYLPVGKPAAEFALEHYAASPKVGKMVAMVGYYPPYAATVESHAAIWKLIDTVAAKNPDRTARGQASMAQAWEAKRAYDRATYLNAPDIEALAKVAEDKLEKVVSEYGDCKRPIGSGAPLGEEAGGELFEIRYLRVGKPALETRGEDLDGAKFDLNEYRGKVVVLVFWASWCGPCMREVPHERELVAAMAGKPFALIGVNGDDDKDKALKAVKDESINWRSFFNGGANRNAGTITKAWNVRKWPTVYVLDAKGTIRHKDLRGDALDAAVKKLVAETEAK